MSIIEKVAAANSKIIALENAKQQHIQEIKAIRSTSIGSIVVPIDPAQHVEAIASVTKKYDALIAEAKAALREEVDTAEKAGKRRYYDAMPLEYNATVQQIVKEYNEDTVLPERKLELFLHTVQTHADLQDKWAMPYILAAMELFPDSKEIFNLLDTAVPELAAAKKEQQAVDTAKRLAEVFELSYYGLPESTSQLERIAAKGRLHELGANSNYAEQDRQFVYEAFCDSIGVVYVPAPAAQNV